MGKKVNKNTNKNKFKRNFLLTSAETAFDD